MQNHDNTLLLLRALSGKSEPNLVFLTQRVFDTRPFKLLGNFEMEAIFAPKTMHISKILL